jgi:ribosomal protein S15P/S13E
MPHEVQIDVDDWAADSADLLAFDRQVHAAEDAQRGRVLVRCRPPVFLGQKEAALAARQISTRYQRCQPIRNAASATAQFDRILERHRALHDVGKPLVRADHDHTCDTWQWVLRLDALARLPVQIAALFHDIERLQSEADVRIKDTHAQRGARLMREALRDLGIDRRIVDAAARLVATHERPEADPDLGLLNDADALSFFGVNSWGFVAHYGPAHTRKKVAYTLARMSPRARLRVAELRHPPVIMPWLQP